jgi:hypothetical protein
LLKHILTYMVYCLYNFFMVSIVAQLHQSLSLMLVFNLSSMFPYMMHDVSCCLLLSVNSKAAFNNE